MAEITPRIKDTRCWAYRLADDGTVESKIFTSRAHVPVGLGWVDSPARVHEAVKSTSVLADTEKAVEGAATRVVEANQDLHTAMGSDKSPLFEIAEQMNLKVDKRWGIDRLKEEIAKAMKADTSADKLAPLEPNRLPPFVYSDEAL